MIRVARPHSYSAVSLREPGFAKPGDCAGNPRFDARADLDDSDCNNLTGFAALLTQFGVACP